MNTGEEVLLCFLHAPSFPTVRDFKMPLYLFQEAQTRGSGGRRDCTEFPDGGKLWPALTVSIVGSR